MQNGHTALIAEDNAGFRESIISMLEPLAVSCITAVDGHEAIEVLRDRSRDVHLLITDMEMPRRDGWDVIRAAREHRGDELPIIMQTGQTSFAYVPSRARDLGIVLIDKLDLRARLVPAVRDALGL